MLTVEKGAMNVLNNYDRMCCACLNESPDMLYNLSDKYSDEEPDLTLRTVLAEVSGFHINEDEGSLPRSLCNGCLELARTCYRFRRLCRESHCILIARKYLKSEQSDVSETAVCGNYGNNESSKSRKRKKDKHKIVKIKNKSSKRKPKGTTKAQERLYGECLWQPATCSECSQTVNNVPALLAHRSTQHTARFQCLQCGAGLTTSRGLEFHHRKHLGLRPEVCSTCGATFADPRTLRIHENRHAGTLRHICPVCGRLFPARAPLQRHTNKHHPRHTNSASAQISTTIL